MYIGIDLGGTNIAAGIVNKAGELLATDSTPTMSFRTAEEITDDIIMLTKRITEKNGYSISDIDGIGIGCPSAVDDKNGIVVQTANLKMNNFEIKKYINREINVPVRLANDADCAAMGEYMVNYKGVDSFVFVTLGTGVGGGIILDGKLYTGFNNISTELGHITLNFDGPKCGCGKYGCFEAYASVTALINQTKAEMEKSPDSLMHKMAENEGKVTGRTSFDAAKQGDMAALKVVKNYTRYIAEGIVSIENLLQPQVIVIGGGISKEGAYILNPVMEFVEKYRFNRNLETTKIEIAKLFNDAGIIGAAMLCTK